MASPTATRLALPRRQRRLRRTESIRSLVRETRLTPDCFIYPLFVVEGQGIRKEVSSMQGVFQLSVDQAVEEARAARAEGISGVLLFGLPETKDAIGSQAYNPDAAVQNAVRALKREVQDLVLFTDVCLCEYTSHGHCGIVDGDEIVNDATVEQLVQAALSHATAGADFVAPSDMMDGRVAAIRDALDDAGFTDTLLMSYAVKFASAYYGPFREAADSTPSSGDRQSYQMDFRNPREAVREALLDVDEGADWLMVKPALPYLDVIRAVRDASRLPLSAYNVSGEYSAVKAAAANGWLDEARIVRENLLAIRRAGADQIITYHARDALKGKWL
jgi:porphobilinogen synthase